VSGPTIHHGTPMTPRAALMDVCAGRAMCVSFYRPDDVEAVEAISPAIMFRQRRFFVLEAGDAQRAGMGERPRLGTVLRLVRTAPIHAGTMGGNPRHAGSAKPAQRRAAERVAAWSMGSSPLAYGRADRAVVAALRQIRAGMSRMDRRGQGYRLPGISRPHGGSFARARQSLAGPAYDARHGGGVRLPVHQRGQHLTRTEWMAL